jgi:metallo-beta-lactamase family protein
MELTFAGAAREVTGSCHILRVLGRTIMLDCGLFQGRRSEVGRKNRALPLPVGGLDAVVLSHAHIDHAGRLPFLVAEGYRGRIHSTVATRDLCEVMLADSAHIQEKDVEFLRRHDKPAEDPIYTLRDVSTTMTQMTPHRYGDRFEVAPGIFARYYDAGHILGSASVTIEWEEGGQARRLGFSGDIGRSGLAIIRDPQPVEQVDWLIMESTYGDRDHESVEGAKDHLARVVQETAARGGRVLIPAFAVGRTQELLYDLHELARDGRCRACRSSSTARSRTRRRASSVTIRATSTSPRRSCGASRRGGPSCSTSTSCASRPRWTSRRRSTACRGP